MSRPDPVKDKSVWMTYAKELEAQLKQARSIDVYNQGWNDALKALIQVVNKDKGEEVPIRDIEEVINNE